MALAAAAQLVEGLRLGYLRMGIGGGRGMTTDYVFLDTPIRRALGAFTLESIAVLFGALAIRPRYALRPRFLVPSIAAMMLASILIGILYG